MKTFKTPDYQVCFQFENTESIKSIGSEYSAYLGPSNLINLYCKCSIIIFA